MITVVPPGPRIEVTLGQTVLLVHGQVARLCIWNPALLPGILVLGFLLSWFLVLELHGNCCHCL